VLHLLTNTGVFSTPVTTLYKIYRTFSMNLEYYQPIITMDVLTETLTLKFKLTLISSLYDVKFWKELQFVALMSFTWYVWFWKTKYLQKKHTNIYTQLEGITNTKNNRMKALTNSTDTSTNAEYESNNFSTSKQNSFWTVTYLITGWMKPNNSQ
jgi:hypothetical protein